MGGHCDPHPCKATKELRPFSITWHSPTLLCISWFLGQGTPALPPY